MHTSAAAMPKNFAFKILAPKDIATVLTMIGVHPPVTADIIDKPTADVALAIFQNVSEFSYDMEVQQMKAQMPGCIQHVEIYEDAMDVLTTFKLSRQLALINLIEDFNLKDVWEPSPKRFRTILSGMVNFCRYKEAQFIVITELKESVHSLDVARLELVDKSNQREQELVAARDRHNQELNALWAAENEVQEIKMTIEKLRKQGKLADRVCQDAEGKLAETRGRAAGCQQRLAEVRGGVADLQGQIADSPEGLEEEVRELQLAARQQKARLEEKGDEKRARAQRQQVLAQLTGLLEALERELGRLGEAAAGASTVRGRTQGAREELAGMRQSLATKCAEAADLEQALQQVTAELERGKQVHEERMRRFEARRQQALVQHKELQARQTEEQRQQLVLQSQRLELEAELASVRRAHNAEMMELHTQHKSLLESSEAYVRGIDMRLVQYKGSLSTGRAASPDATHVRRRLICSPSPARSPCERGPLRSDPVA